MAGESRRKRPWEHDPHSHTPFVPESPNPRLQGRPPPSPTATSPSNAGYARYLPPVLSPADIKMNPWGAPVLGARGRSQLISTETDRLPLPPKRLRLEPVTQSEQSPVDIPRWIGNSQELSTSHQHEEMRHAKRSQSCDGCSQTFAPIIRVVHGLNSLYQQLKSMSTARSTAEVRAMSSHIMVDLTEAGRATLRRSIRPY